MKLSYTIRVLLLISILTTAAETSEKGLYIGANVGSSTGKVNKQISKDTLCSGTAGCIVTDYNEMKNAFDMKVYGGYLLHDNFGVEGKYFNLGQLSFDATSNQSGSYESTVAVQGIGIDLIGYLPINKELFVFAGAGVTYANRDEEIVYTRVNTGTTQIIDEDKWNVGFSYGIGLEYDLTPNIGIRLEAENYYLSENNIDTGFDMQLYSVGLVYSFGKRYYEELKDEPTGIIEKSHKKHIVESKEREKEIYTAPIIEPVQIVEESKRTSRTEVKETINKPQPIKEQDSFLTDIKKQFVFDKISKVETSFMLGYNYTENSTQIENPGYFLGALETQLDFNSTNLFPELFFMYLPSIDYTTPHGENARGFRTAVNLGYSFKNVSTKYTPYIKAGIGYENIWKNEIPDNQSSLFLDFGVGIKYPISNTLSFKAEAIYLEKPTNNKALNVDNNLLTLVGLTYVFSDMKRYDSLKIVPKPESIKEVVPKDNIINKSLVEERTIQTKRIILQSDVIFKNNNVQFTPIGKRSLKQLVKNLDKNDRITIVGYTDNIGSLEDNFEKSKLQIDSVKWKLFDYGVSTKRIETHAMGEAKPVASNKSKKGRSMNRRIEIEIKSSTTK